MFSSAVVRASRLNPWKTKPSFRLRIPARVFLSSCGNVDAVEQVSPGCRAVEAAEDVHERRLAAPARAHDRDESAPLDVDAHATQRVDARLPQCVVLVNTLDAEDRAVRSRHRRSRSGHALGLPAYCIARRSRGRRRERARDHIVAGAERASEHARHFRVRVVGDTERDLHGHDRLIRLKLPHHRALGARRSGSSSSRRDAIGATALDLGQSVPICWSPPIPYFA